MSAFGKHRGLQSVLPLGPVFAAGMARPQPVARPAASRPSMPSIASVMRSRHAWLHQIANPIYKAMPAAHAPICATPGKPGYKLQITGYTV